jgi:hypothetical protein
MRYVPSVSSTTASPTTRQVKGLSPAQAVKPVFPREQPDLPHVEPHAAHQEPVRPVAQQQHRTVAFEDRRKACRRVSHLPVLIELRSGIDRRRHNLREGDTTEHIDETA